MAMMKGFSNVFRIPELRKKILVTLGLVFVCRLISLIPTPGVDWTVIAQTMAGRESGGIMGLLSTFTGGAVEHCGIGFLSIWPYISASIVIQLLGSMVPSLQKLKKEGESGRQRLAQITRYLTIVLCIVQSWSIASVLCNPEMLGIDGRIVVTENVFGFKLMTVICMTSASLFVMWIADQITTFGIGNGASLIIMINITSRLPDAIKVACARYFTPNANANMFELPVLIILFLLVVMGTVLLTQGVRKIAIHATRRSVGGGNTYGMQQTFMPLRVNYTGVMPIIFAQPLIQIPAYLLMKVTDPNSEGFSAAVYGFAKKLAEQPTSLSYIIIFSFLIMFFAFFWVATQFNAVDISENLKKDGSYVPGIRPGKATAEYLDDVMTKITLIGGTGLLIVALFPTLLMNGMGKAQSFPYEIAQFFGGTSLLIIVGVALDTLRIMESHLLVRKYDGFLSHGTLRGRGGV